MDDPNNEFEDFLRQFRLREPGPLPQAAFSASRWSVRWIVAAAAVPLVVLASFAVVRVAMRPPVVPIQNTAGPTTAIPAQLEPGGATKTLEPPSKSIPTKPPEKVTIPQPLPVVVQQPPPASPQEPAAPPAQESPNSQSDPERALLERACGACHTADVAKNMNYGTKDEYVNFIAGERAKGASISDKEAEALADYLYNNRNKQSEPPRKKK